jgi:hypothetical protein
MPRAAVARAGARFALAGALLQQNPSRQKPLVHSLFTLQPSPFPRATHVVPFSQTGVLPLQPPRTRSAEHVVPGRAYAG